MIEEGIMATEITDGQVIHVCLPQNNEITHIDVCWQDEVTMNLDLSLMYILSGQKEIQDYVNQTSKPEIDNYIEIQAKIYDQTDKNNCRVLDKKGKNFKFEVVPDENLAPIIGYVQKLDIKFDKQVKDYFFQNKLKKMQTDF